MNEIYVGIDLGTTYSAIACVDESGIPEIIPNAEGQRTTPSVVFFQEDRVIVGHEAAAQALIRPGDVVQCIKRRMGDEEYRFRETYAAEQISSYILRKVVGDAEQRLGRTIRHAVITVPAYFTALPLEKTKQAGEMAGLCVEDLLHEPEAAAIPFGITHLVSGESALICDLGGGTYDATIMEMKEGVLRAMKTRGSCQLGGHDWTARLAELLADRIAAAGSDDPREDLFLSQRLNDLAEAAKRQLSSARSATIQWSTRAGVRAIEVSRDEFEDATRPLMNEVVEKTAEAIFAAGFVAGDFTHVLLVGGSSRLPSFAEAIERLVGQAPRQMRFPDEAVACGAALVAAAYQRGEAGTTGGRITVLAPRNGRIIPIAVQRRNSHALGVLTQAGTHANPRYEPETMIDENTDLPAKAEKQFIVAADTSTLQVPVVQINQRNEIQEQLGAYVFEELEVRRHDAPVRVVFSYDSNGLPHVSVLDLLTGREYAARRERNGMTQSKSSPAGEDGVVVIAIDCSGSMSGDKLREAKKVFQDIATKYGQLGRRWSISVVNFGGGFEIYPAQILMQPTRSIPDILGVAEKLTCGGGTPLEAGLDKMREVLEQAQGQRLGIIISDGQPAGVTKCLQTAQTLKAMGIQIASIPVGTDADHDFLKALGDLESDIEVDNAGRGMGAAVVNLLKKMS